MLLATLRPRFPFLARRLQSSPKALYSSSPVRSSGALADVCDTHVVSSPFPPIAPGPYLPLAEFLMAKWQAAGGSAIPSDKVAIIDGSTGLQRTFGEYYQRACGLAATLRYEMGVQPGDTVCLFAPNHVDFLPCALAATLCGAKVTPVNPLCKSYELQRILERSESSVVIAHSSTLETALDAVKETGHSVKDTHVLCLTDAGEALPEGVADVDSLVSHSKSFDKTFRRDSAEIDQELCFLPYSSGTTGLPKGVCLSNANMASNLLQVEMVEGQVFPSDHTLICPLPFFHIYGLTASVLYCGWQGQTLVTNSRRFDLEQFCGLVEDHKPRRAHLVPPIILKISKEPVVEKFNMSSLECIISAAAPLSTEVEAALMSRISGCEVKQSWGMSEISPFGCFTPDHKIRPGSIGPVVSSTYAKIIDNEGKSLGPNQTGELCIKGPQRMSGYLNDQEKTDECLSRSGWLRTGDIAHYDEEGYFYITDRIKELIKVRGYPVAPAELEAVLLTNDLVNDVAVIQIPDELSGELPRAYIVLKDSENATDEVKRILYEFVKERVTPYKRLDGGIVFVDSIPKSASGKILRRLLRDELKAELEAKKGQ